MGGGNGDNGGNGTSISTIWLSVGELLVSPVLVRFQWLPSSLPVTFGVMPDEIMVYDCGVGNGLMYLLFLGVILPFVLHLTQYCLFGSISTISPDLHNQ